MFLSQPENKGKLAFFMGIDNVKFRKPVVPGDRLELKIEILKMRSGFGKAKGEAYSDGEFKTEAEFTFAVVDAPAAKE
jgi:3-hydroxymyristoyl/3-hydroxydecanoyl-(acyl carrier protein) dehydratase